MNSMEEFHEKMVVNDLACLGILKIGRIITEAKRTTDLTLRVYLINTILFTNP